MNSLYIHIPFCIRKCKYCDFLSYEGKENELEKYFEYLIKDFKFYENKVYDTIYFGGGTPSLAKDIYLKKLLDNIDKKEDAEITLELNPKTVDFEKLKKIKETGINRLSIGVQTFNDDLLKVLGRLNSSEDSFRVYKEARELGFKNISLDLMFSLPDQSMENLKDDLKKIIKLNPEHISIYSLIWEEGTKFWELREKGELKELDEDLESDMFEEIIKNLEENGYEHYEISNFAKKGFRSKHNVNYWKNGEYAAIGIGATAYINNVRYKNIENIDEYYKSIDDNKKVYEYSEIVEENIKEENRIILGLRLLKDGIIIENKDYLKKAEYLLSEGFLEKDINGYRLSKKGLYLANNVFAEFISI